MSGGSAGQMLRLRAIDPDDIAPLAAHIQDAVVKIADMAFLPQQRRFALMLNRFKWEDLLPGVGPHADDAAPFRRIRSALHFDGVMAVRSKGLRLSDADAVTVLLTMGFEAGEDSTGTLILTFAGGGAVRLDVECIDAWLTDIGQPWSTKSLPLHERTPDDPQG